MLIFGLQNIAIVSLQIGLIPVCVSNLALWVQGRTGAPAAGGSVGEAAQLGEGRGV